jgi:hypothetical protein
VKEHLIGEDGCVGEPLCAGELVGVEVRDTDKPCHPPVDNLVQPPHNGLHVRERVGPVDEQQVDLVGLELF